MAGQRQLPKNGRAPERRLLRLSLYQAVVVSVVNDVPFRAGRVVLTGRNAPALRMCVGGLETEIQRSPISAQLLGRPKAVPSSEAKAKQPARWVHPPTLPDKPSIAAHIRRRDP